VPLSEVVGEVCAQAVTSVASRRRHLARRTAIGKNGIGPGCVRRGMMRE